MSFLPQPCCPDNPPQPVGSCGCFAVAEVDRVPASATAIVVAPANLLRRGLILWNDSTATLYIKLGLAVSVTDFTWRLSSQSGYELPTPIYQGDITGLWDNATGALQVTEMM